MLPLSISIGLVFGNYVPTAGRHTWLCCNFGYVGTYQDQQSHQRTSGRSAPMSTYSYICRIYYIQTSLSSPHSIDERATENKCRTVRCRFAAKKLVHL